MSDIKNRHVPIIFNSNSSRSCYRIAHHLPEWNCRTFTHVECETDWKKYTTQVIPSQYGIIKIFTRPPSNSSVSYVPQLFEHSHPQQLANFAPSDDDHCNFGMDSHTKLAKPIRNIAITYEPLSMQVIHFLLKLDIHQTVLVSRSLCFSYS